MNSITFPNQTDIQQFRKRGFVTLRGLLAKKLLHEQRDRIEHLVSERNRNTAPLEERDTYKRAFIQITNLWRATEQVHPLVFHSTLAETAARLMGVDGVRLYHDQALFKEPGGGHTPWHRDQVYWPLDTPHTVTAWIPLVDVPKEMGPLSFIPGSHHWKEGRSLVIGDESDAYFEDLVKRKNAVEERTAFKLGDVSFHSGWTLHRAGANNTWNQRAVMTVIFMDTAARVSTTPTATQLIDRDAFIPGRNPGEPADTERNPILWEQ